MPAKIVAMSKQIFLFRHGLSQANKSDSRKMLFQKFFQVIKPVVGFDRTLKAVKFLDKLRGYDTPYKEPDSRIPLDKVGLIQAELTGNSLAEKNIIPDIILCSDYFRARQTVDGIIKGMKASFQTDFKPKVLYSDVIVERSLGKTHGFPIGYFPVLFPEVHKEIQIMSKYELRPPEGESILDVRFERIPGLLDILNSLSFKTLFIVGHGLTNMCIRSLLTGEDIVQLKIGSPNLGVNHFLFNEEQQTWQIDSAYDPPKPISEEVPWTE